MVYCLCKGCFKFKPVTSQNSAPMNFLDRLSKVAEIVGSLGIVISLFLVSGQYKNNSLALETSTANSVNANIADWYNSFFENTQETESFLKFLTDPDSVSQTEKFQSIMRLHSLNLHLQNALYLERQGVLDENLRKTISMAVYSGLKQPGFYFFWDQRKSMYTEEWQIFVEDIIASQKHTELEELFDASAEENTSE